MAVYLVTWDLNKEKSNYEHARKNLIAQLSRYEHVKDPGLDSVWFISSPTSAEVISDNIRTGMDTNDRIIVTKLNSGQHQGWLNTGTWDWINVRINA